MNFFQKICPKNAPMYPVSRIDPGRSRHLHKKKSLKQNDKAATIIWEMKQVEGCFSHSSKKLCRLNSKIIGLSS